MERLPCNFENSADSRLVCLSCGMVAAFSVLRFLPQWGLRWQWWKGPSIIPWKLDFWIYIQKNKSKCDSPTIMKNRGARKLILIKKELLWNIYKQKVRLGLQIPAESYIKPNTQATQCAHVWNHAEYFKGFLLTYFCILCRQFCSINIPWVNRLSSDVGFSNIGNQKCE